MKKPGLSSRSCSPAFSITEGIKDDNEGRATGNSLFLLSEDERRNIYKGIPSENPISGLTQKTLAKTPKKTTPSLDMHPVRFLSDGAIDQLIRDEEKNLVNRNSGAAEKKKQNLFFSPGAKRGENIASSSSSLCSPKPTFKKKIGSAPLPTLSNVQIDGIAGSLETENALVQEFENDKRADYLRQIAAAVCDSNNESGGRHDRRDCRIEEEEEKIWEEVKLQLEKDNREKAIFERFRDRAEGRQSNNLSFPVPRKPTVKSFSNSPIPGPYLTLHQCGDYTCFEALAKRSKYCRYSVFPSVCIPTLNGQLDETRKRVALLPSAKKKEKKTIDFDFVHENGESERLRKWKARIGLSS